LTAPQQQIVLDLLHAPRFADQAPAEIYASLPRTNNKSRPRAVFTEGAGAMSLIVPGDGGRGSCVNDTQPNMVG
jgi:hypothetical protein